MSSTEQIISNSFRQATLLDYKMFINMLEKYPVNSILRELKIKVAELEKELKNE